MYHVMRQSLGHMGGYKEEVACERKKDAQEWYEFLSETGIEIWDEETYQNWYGEVFELIYEKGN